MRWTDTINDRHPPIQPQGTQRLVVPRGVPLARRARTNPPAAWSGASADRQINAYRWSTSQGRLQGPFKMSFRGALQTESEDWA